MRAQLCAILIFFKVLQAHLSDKLNVQNYEYRYIIEPCDHKEAVKFVLCLFFKASGRSSDFFETQLRCTGCKFQKLQEFSKNFPLFKI